MDGDVPQFESSNAFEINTRLLILVLRVLRALLEETSRVALNWLAVFRLLIQTCLFFIWILALHCRIFCRDKRARRQQPLPSDGGTIVELN